MNSAQYYELIRELKAINTKLDVIVQAVVTPTYEYTYTPPPGSVLPPMGPGRIGHVPTSGPIGMEQELPFKDG